MEMYQELRREMEELTFRLSARYQAHLRCGAGCSACCQHDLSVFPVEAAGISEAVSKLTKEVKAKIHEQAVLAESDAMAACPFLINDLCSIYESRPLICLTQGLPLLYAAEDGVQEIDFCPLNFVTETAISDLDETNLVPLDDVNLKLVMANHGYCAGAVPDLEEGTARRKMSEIILQAT